MLYFDFDLAKLVLLLHPQDDWQMFFVRREFFERFVWFCSLKLDFRFSQGNRTGWESVALYFYLHYPFAWLISGFAHLDCSLYLAL